MLFEEMEVLYPFAFCN